MICPRVIVLLSWLWCAGALLAVAESAEPLFPGFTATDGGHGGQIIRVTTLTAEGPGSLGEALATEGPRIVVFEIGGVIDLERQVLQVTHPHLTLAGHTAPAPGITLIRGGIRVATHDVIIQHLRVRPGDAGHAPKSGWDTDGISTHGANAHDIVVDHCSLTWAVDENLSASGPRLEGPEATSRRITFSNNIIAEGLSNSSHAKGEHSMGTLVHDFCREIAIIGNLYAHNKSRNPYFKAHTTGVVVNNLIYNPGDRAIYLNFWGSQWNGSGLRPRNAQVTIAGNTLVHGPNTSPQMAMVSPRGDAWLDDNMAVRVDGSQGSLRTEDITVLDVPPVWPDGLTVLPWQKAAERVLEQAGARPWERDVIDARIINSVRTGGGRIIDSQDDVGGYPAYEPQVRRLDPPTSPADVADWLASFIPAR